MAESNNAERKVYKSSIDIDLSDNINIRVLCYAYYLKYDRDNTIGCDMYVSDTDILYFYSIYDTIKACCLGLYIIKELKE